MNWSISISYGYVAGRADIQATSANVTITGTAPLMFTDSTFLGVASPADMRKVATGVSGLNRRSAVDLVFRNRKEAFDTISTMVENLNGLAEVMGNAVNVVDGVLFDNY